MNQLRASAILGLFLLAGAADAIAANGLTGRYYDENDFNSQKTSRPDATVDFDWGTSIPAGTALTSGNNFSVRWTGQIEPPRLHSCLLELVFAQRGGQIVL